MRPEFVLAFFGLVSANPEVPRPNPWVDIKLCSGYEAEIIGRRVHAVSTAFVRASRRIDDLVKRFETYRDGSLPPWRDWTAEEASTYSTYANFIQPSPLMYGQIFPTHDEPGQDFAPSSLKGVQRLLKFISTEYLKPFTSRSGFTRRPKRFQITCGDEWVERITRRNHAGSSISSWVDDRVRNPRSLPKLWSVTLDRNVDEQPLISRLNAHKQYWAAVWWSNLRPEFTDVLALWDSSWAVWGRELILSHLPDPLSKPMMLNMQFDLNQLPAGAVHLTQIGRNDLAFPLIRWMIYVGLNATSPRLSDQVYFNQTGINMIQEETETSGGLLNLLRGSPDYPGADPSSPPVWLESMNYFYEERSNRNDMNVGFLVLALFFIDIDWSRGVNQPMDWLIQAGMLQEWDPFTDLLDVLYVQRPAIREALQNKPFFSTRYQREPDTDDSDSEDTLWQVPFSTYDDEGDDLTLCGTRQSCDCTSKGSC